AEAQDMINKYFEAYPGVRAYLDAVVADAHKCGFATTMFGRKRHIPELRAGGPQRAFGERTAMNHPMQGSAADIIKMAMVSAAERLRSEFPEAELMLQVHDELDLSVPKAQVDAVSAMLKEVMESVCELKVPLVVDLSSGKNWAEAH
ncbi:MAG: DNA polymerase I, partial [Eggerthellaceae bacterium]|nr:DNA polymerase I [Eggerthellaceae bacterium]